MAVQVMYHNQSIPLHTHPSFQSNHTTQSPNSSINGQTLLQSDKPTTNKFAALSKPTKNHRISLLDFIESPQQSPSKTNLGNILDEEIRKIVSEMVKETNKKQDIMFITTCKIWNQLHENKQILNKISNINGQNHHSDVKKVLDKLNIIEQQNNGYKKLVKALIKQQEQHGNILLNQLEHLQEQSIEHKKSLGILTTQQQNLKKNLNNKVNSLTNKLNNIQINLKQSAKKQRIKESNILSKKILKEQKRSPTKQVEEKQLKTEDKITLKINNLSKDMQHQQKLFDSSLEKLNKKFDDQTNKLIYNSNFGINKLLKQIKIIKGIYKNNKQSVAHQINNLNNVKSIKKKNSKSNEIISGNNIINKKISKEQNISNSNELLGGMNRTLLNIYLKHKQKTSENVQNSNSKDIIGSNSNKKDIIGDTSGNIKNFQNYNGEHNPNTIDMSKFMNEAVNVLNNANTAIKTIVNDNNNNYVT